jgi:ubiquinone/menaquinone biosynthesis C-methylase UbiE
MPDEVSTTIESYDRIASEYCRHTLRDEFRRVEEEFLERFMTHMGKEAPLVADIGCGDGRDSEYLIKKGARVLLVDLSRSMLAEAARQVPEGVHLNMDVRNLAFLDTYLDGLWASGILYHLPKRELPGALDEIHRVIAPGGVFSFNFKAGEGEGMEENPRSYPGAPRYYAYYRAPEMKGLLSGLFEVIEEDLYPVKAFGDTILQLWCRRSQDS